MAPPDTTDSALARATTALARLRRFRGRREPDLGIASIVDRIRTEADRTERRLGAAIDAWVACVPEPLLRRTRVTGYSAGVLTVAVEGAAARFELDRRLRGDLLGHLRSRLRTPLTRVRLTGDGAGGSPR
ncbi:MAG: DUF721 domain-containing protein [Phycisphaeraceae bacterium]|nr:DUF721 domain-containing protein [Phycisphaeraceae bacterium]